MADTMTSIDDRASYAIGRQMGEQLTKNPFDGMQPEAVLSGMADALAGKESPISLEDMNEAIDDLNKRMLQQQQEQAGEQEAAGEAFLAQNAEKAEIETSVLVTISDFLSPIYLPKKPEIIEAISGRNKIDSSIIILSTYLFLQL